MNKILKYKKTVRVFMVISLLLLALFFRFYLNIFFNHERNVGQGDLSIEKQKLIKYYAQDTVRNSSIRDVNNDNDYDIVIRWEPINGCCLRVYDDIYFFKYVSGILTKVNTEPIQILNPYYLPDNTLINMNYGHPRETEIMKKIWQGHTLINVATVSPLDIYNHTSKFKYEKKGMADEIIEEKNIDKIFKKYPNYKWFINVL